MQTWQIILIALAVALVVCVIVIAVMVANRKKQKLEETNNPKYTLEEAKEKLEIMRRGEYLVLVRNVTYSVGDDGQIAVGTYCLTSAVNTQTKLNVRYNGLVKEYDSGTVFTFTAGDTICCVSGGGLMRPVD